MQFLAKNHLKRWGIVALLPVLTACSLAPGMRMDDKYANAKTDAAAEAAGMKHITLELVQAERREREQVPGQDISALVAKAKPYLIGNGDILTIVVWDHPELSAAAMSGTTIIADGSSAAGFAVDHEGLVQFPHVGKLKLAGLTQQQARNLLIDKLARVLKKPDLTLRVQAYRSQRIYIDGEVKLPGTQAINDIPMTLLEALNRAGGFSASGDQSQIRINRKGITYPVDLPQLVRRGINPASILLNDGDVLRVISRDESKVFVLGEVAKPVSLPMRNGKLTLNEALGDAGGVNPLSGEARQLYVVRNGEDAQPIVYHLDASSPVALALAENFELVPRDVVYVDAAPVARWNRVISLILPSAQAVVNAAK
jgi:polysaccharide export outer membrane protein